MQSDLLSWLAMHDDRAYELHEKHLNPAFVRMLKTIGFDKTYVRGEGPYLWDEAGNKYLDFLSGFGVFSLGRNHPKVKAVLHEVIDGNLPNHVRMGCTPLQGLVAEKLTQHLGGDLTRVFFCNSGAETIEGAIKFARSFTRRQDVVYCDHAFHGLTTGALAITGADVFRDRFGELMPGTRRVPFNDLAALERELATGQVAAFIVEPLQGTSCEVAADGYLADAQLLCRKYGTLLVLDEVQTGLGRTGKWFCFQHWPGVEPDVVCVAKALSGGYVPVAAIVTRPAIMDGVFDSMERSFIHANTFGGMDLAMAAAYATLTVIEEDRLVENAAEMGRSIRDCLGILAAESPFVTQVRGKGLMFGMELARPKDSLPLKMTWDVLHRLNVGMFSQVVVMPLMRDHRILTQVAGYHTEVIKFLPPLIVSESDRHWFLNAIRDVLTNMERFPGSAWETVTDLAKGAIIS